MIIDFAGYQVTLLSEGALWIPDLGLFCAADLHFEKGSSYAGRATFLPPYDSQDTLRKLKNVISRLEPKIVIAAGDSFHDTKAAARMPLDLRDELNALIESMPSWHWLEGNHDPGVNASISGPLSHELSVGGITFRHETLSGATPEVSGHYHPKVRLTYRGHRIAAPCFVRLGTRLILPSFGQFTGGLDIDSDAFRAVMPRENRDVFLINQGAVFQF